MKIIKILKPIYECRIVECKENYKEPDELMFLPKILSHSLSEKAIQLTAYHQWPATKLKLKNTREPIVLVATEENCWFISNEFLQLHRL